MSTPQHSSSQVLTTSEPRLWRAILPASSSVFGSVEFASIVERQLGHDARLFVFNEGEEIAYPFFLRSVSALPFVTDSSDSFDSLSPEYTGPLSRREISPRVSAAFRDAFADYCRRERIVAEFAHLHPWNWSADLLNDEGLNHDREIVYVDLTFSEEQIWLESFTPACRNKIRQAQNEYVAVFQATTEEHIREFYGVYRQTMDRRQASARYYFSLEYFIALFREMPNNAVFFLARYRNEIVGATLYLHDDMYAYSYLTGANHAFQHIRPTNALNYEAIRWAQHAGKTRLILGGGYEPDDGIFRFKSSFSPLRARFCTYKRVHMPEEYSALCRSWSEYYQCVVSDSGYFPSYRAVPACMELREPAKVNCP